MRFSKWTIGVMIAVLVVGCATYPVGYWVDPRLDEQRVENDPIYRDFDDQRFENCLLACDGLGRKKADSIAPTLSTRSGGGDIILLPILPIIIAWQISNEQRWADVYTNQIKACMEDRGYHWVYNPKGKKIGYMKAKRFAPSQIDESQSKEHP